MRTVSRWVSKVAVAGVALAVLAGCAETKFVMHTAKRFGDANKSQGNYKIGTPYQIKGKWYFPKVDMNHDEVGIASWYGPNFHGKPTANGETFDQWQVSAAHRTLPLPSVVRVTNLENGRSLVIRVNDRGPFAHNRVLDLSRRAAELLDVVQKGTAKVRVQILPDESRVAAQRARAGGTILAKNDMPIKIKQGETVASVPVAAQALPDPTQKVPSKLHVTPQPVTTDGVVVDKAITQSSSTQQAMKVDANAALPTRLFIQAGAFSDMANAERVKATLARIGQVNVSPIYVSGRELYRVRIGPIENPADADFLLTQVVEAGYANARTVMGTY